MPMVDARRESRHVSLSSGRDPRGCRTARNGFILPNGTPSSTKGRGEVFPRTVQNVGVEGQDETREHKQFGIRCGAIREVSQFTTPKAACSTTHGANLTE